MHKWCNYPWITCIGTTLTRLNFTRAPCSCKQWRFKKLPSRLFVPENTLLRGTILPHTSHDVSPLDYRQQGKAWTLQFPVLCLGDDYLNCWSSLITQETVLSNQAPSSSPNSGPHSAQVSSLSWDYCLICCPYKVTPEDLLEKEMATHSSTLAWKIPWMEEPGGLQSMGSQRVGHGWAISLSLSPFSVSQFFLTLSLHLYKKPLLPNS